MAIKLRRVEIDHSTGTLNGRSWYTFKFGQFFYPPKNGLQTFSCDTNMCEGWDQVLYPNFKKKTCCTKFSWVYLISYTTFILMVNGKIQQFIPYFVHFQRLKKKFDEKTCLLRPGTEIVYLFPISRQCSIAYGQIFHFGFCSRQAVRISYT